MGISFSNITSNDIIITDIKKTITELIDDYKIWTNDELCNNLELIYNGKLVKLTTEQLKGITSSIGYNNTDTLSKTDLCIMIMGHYKKRVLLLRAINGAINKCNNMLHHVKNGNVCLNVTKFIDDFYICNQIPNAVWIDKNDYQLLLNKLKTQDRLSGLMVWINGLDEKYNESLKKLFKIVMMIKDDINKTIDEVEFRVIENYALKTLKNMILTCEIYYLLAINY